MRRIVVHRVPMDEYQPRGFSLGSAFVSLAVGGGLALALHEIWTAANHGGWSPGHALPRASALPAIAAAKAALASDPHLSEAEFLLLPGGRGSIELHGWVADRRERAIASRLVAAAIAPVALVNSLLVRGEDDEQVLFDDYTEDAVSA